MMSDHNDKHMFKKTYEEMLAPLTKASPNRYCTSRKTYGYEVTLGSGVVAGAWRGKHKGKSGPIVFVYTATHGVGILVDGKEIRIPMNNLGVRNGKGEWVEDAPFDVTGRRLAIGDFVAFPESSRSRTYTLGFGHITAFTSSGNSTVEVKAKDGAAVSIDRWGPPKTTLYSFDRVLKLPLEEEDAVAWMLNGFNRLDI